MSKARDIIDGKDNDATAQWQVWLVGTAQTIFSQVLGIGQWVS